MKVFVVRLNPDTRDCRAYSKYPTRKEYESIHYDSPMDGFHEAVNFLSEDGVVRGYLPPRHLKSIRDNQEFLLITITAKSAKKGGDLIIGVQAGCKYNGENDRKNCPSDISDLSLTWHYYCPDSLSVVFSPSIFNARDLILKKEKWVRGPTYQTNLTVAEDVLKTALSQAVDQDLISKINSVLDYINNHQVSKPTLLVEDSFEEAVVDALKKDDFDIVRGNKKPAQREVLSFQYIRDPKVVAYALKMAKGICADCGVSPFISKRTGLPFLEVHHINKLKDGGQDTIENVIALCPTCHRRRHFG